MSDVTEWRGIPASPGVRRGRARWISKKSDLEGVAAGDVLLARMTSPDWIVALARAGAIATEQGGALCHAAVVAREIGVPAVVGVGQTLRSVLEQDVIEVDGTTGVVRLIARATDQI